MGQLIFFFDRTFGTRLPGAIAKLGPPFQVKWHQEQGYAHDMPDDEWLAAVSAARWVVLSQDRKWHRNASEAEAIKQHDGRCFYLPCCSDRWHDHELIVRHHKQMMSLADTAPPPFIYHLRKNGQFYPVPL